MSLEYVIGLVADETNCLKTIDKVHHEIHAGDHYTATYSTSVLAASTTMIVIKVPDTTTRIHFVADGSAEAAGTFTLNREVTVATTSYTAITPYNNDRNSTKTATTIVGLIPSSSFLTNEGTVMVTYIVGADNPKSRFGGDVGLRNEYILKRNSNYLLRYLATSTTTISFNLYWYED